MIQISSFEPALALQHYFLRDYSIYNVRFGLVSNIDVEIPGGAIIASGILGYPELVSVSHFGIIPT